MPIMAMHLIGRCRPPASHSRPVDNVPERYHVINLSPAMFKHPVASALQVGVNLNCNMIVNVNRIANARFTDEIKFYLPKINAVLF